MSGKIKNLFFASLAVMLIAGVTGGSSTASILKNGENIGVNSWK